MAEVEEEEDEVEGDILMVRVQIVTYWCKIYLIIGN